MLQNEEKQGHEWQVGIWDRMSKVYVEEVDRRFAPLVEDLIGRAELVPGERVLDLGTGTGSVAIRAAGEVGSEGQVVGIDISPEMVSLAKGRAKELGFENMDFREGRAEELPLEDAVFDVVTASLSLMYVIDRAAASREIARVLGPGGRLVAAVWDSSDVCDIVKFQQTAGSFAPTPPVPGVGPGALADPQPFLDQLAEAGIAARVAEVLLEFEFADFDSAWDVLAGVTAAQMSPEVQTEAKNAVRGLMWETADGARSFSNATHLIIGRLQ